MNTAYISENNKAANRQVRIHGLLEKLRNKVHNFNVFDKHGSLIGVVRDVILDASSRLSFLVYKTDLESNVGASIIIDEVIEDEKKNSFLLLSNHIKKIDEFNKSFILDLDKSTMENMSEYSPSATQNNSSTPTASEISLNQDVNIHDAPNNTQDLTDYQDIQNTVEQHIISLLGERLVVNNTKRKVGEIILRKEIETRMVQVPVRREKLIVEQVVLGDEASGNKQLAEIDLGEVETPRTELAGDNINSFDSFDSNLSVSGEFDSPKIASLILNAIALEKKHGCQKVRVTVLVEDEEHKTKYQEWFARASHNG
ncbi:MAG: YsnF/AvaK domain-containing protein [Scytonematopsis contorta HA4267-MV1]|jgi:stress response protein YsnF|nr:YsnF/AvaK domain-containing protein [Scytonematopsis contorta HA4267-MV1]